MSPLMTWMMGQSAFSKCAHDTKLGGVADTPEGRPEGPWLAGEPRKLQSGEVQSPAAWEEQLPVLVYAGSHPAGKQTGRKGTGGPGVNTKLKKSQQQVLAVKKAIGILFCVRQSIVSPLRVVIILSYSEAQMRSHTWSPACSSGLPS
ncbi:hypothetical protein WISP_108152 [Willisornis vidua]|uniref:Uncharacterized protein n=1 Tax=Willisornis vidua TaxID=1566151 RepID=A0ABQ9D0Y7_9PASS|nr:hypothetical protein WISP_108152 [Willisornis vidua]